MRFVAGVLLWLVALSTVAATLIAVQPLQELAVYPEVTASATVIALNDSKLAAEVSARIVEIPVTVGEVVARGAILARLDARDYQTAVARAEAELQAAEARRKLAEDQLRRVQQMQKKNFVSAELLNQRQAEYESQTAALAVRQAELRQARDNLEKCTVRAPFAAIVQERLGQVGELAGPGTPLLRILDAEHQEVSAQVQSRDAASLRAAQAPVLVALGERYPLKLSRLTPAVDRRERSQEARLLFTGKAALPGAEGQVVWTSHIAHLPPEWMVRRNSALGVFVVNDGHAAFIPLPGAEEGRPAPVHLPPDTRIITEGRHTVQPGEEVTPR